MQVSEEIEGRVTKKLSQEFSRTESRLSGALIKLDNFLLKPQVRTLSGIVSRISRTNDPENWEPTGNRSQSDPHPQVECSACRTSNSVDSGPEETFHTLRIQNFSSIKLYQWIQECRGILVVENFSKKFILTQSNFKKRRGFYQKLTNINQ